MHVEDGTNVVAVPSREKQVTTGGGGRNDVIDLSEDANKVMRKEENARKMLKSNLSMRMGQMHELTESLNFLDRMRPLIGDDEYKERAKKLMDFLPDPGTYMIDLTKTSDAIITALTIKKDKEADGDEDKENNMMIESEEDDAEKDVLEDTSSIN